VSGLGPIELVMIGFPGNKFTGEIAPALADLVAEGTIAIVDLIFIMKDEDGNIEGLELAGLEPDVRAQFEAFAQVTTELFSEEDVEDLGQALDPGSSVAALIVEHRWAARLRAAILNADGELLMREPIPDEAVDAVLSAAASA
jgi:Family of unknown function (DUF6325)